MAKHHDLKLLVFRGPSTQQDELNRSPTHGRVYAPTRLLGRSLGAEALLQQLVQIGLGAVLVLVERVHEL